MVDTTTQPALPSVSQITRQDVKDALRAGLSDFQRAPMLSMFFGAVFAIIGLLLTLVLFRSGSGYWLLPLAAGFPLLGPFAAVGLYEMSRRIEAGEPLEFAPILKAGFRSQHGQLPLFAVLTVFVFLVWIVLARVIFAVSFGTFAMTNVMSSVGVFFTGPGLIMIVVGSVIGAALATLLFAISVVGVPLLMDRDIDVVTAMITSFKATIENQSAMAYWGATVAIMIVVAMLPLFLGMIIVFPALGHASWHLYRKVIAT